MLESSQIVRIGKHRVQNITALTFERAGEDAACASGLPLVFVIHGLGGRKERYIEICLALAAEGFIACTLDARFHGERATEEATARLFGIEFAEAFADAVLGTVEDLGILAGYLRQERYGVIGHSMGGYVALKAGVSDSRAHVIVSASGNPDWTMVPPGTYLPAAARAAAHAHSPLIQAERFWPRPLLLLHGDADEVVPITGVRTLHERLQKWYAPEPGRLSFVEYPRGGHEFTPDMAARAVAWMTRHLPPQDATPAMLRHAP